jgi:hypothetical protein
LPDGVQTKNPNLDKFWKVLQWNVLLIQLMAIWHILLPSGMLYGHLVYFSRFGILYREKSGSPVPMLNALQSSGLATTAVTG